MTFIVLGFHGTDCDGSSHEACLAFIAHATTVPEAVTHAFDAGIDAHHRWRIRATEPIPDHWIQDEFMEVVMPHERLDLMPEPDDVKKVRNAPWN